MKTALLKITPKCIDVREECGLPSRHHGPGPLLHEGPPCPHHIAAMMGEQHGIHGQCLGPGVTVHGQSLAVTLDEDAVHGPMNHGQIVPQCLSDNLCTAPLAGRTGENQYP
jgi:hypothetical protein